MSITINVNSGGSLDVIQVAVLLWIKAIKHRGEECTKEVSQNIERKRA